MADRVGRFGDIVGSDGWVRETPSLDHLAEVARECRRQAIDVVGVCGGDGTLSRTLSAMVEAYEPGALPPIVPLRAGNMNTVARAVGCPAWRPERMLAEIVAGCRRGDGFDMAEHQLLSANGSSFGFMIGAGIPVRFLRAYYARRRQGPVAAAAFLLTLVARILAGGSLGGEIFEPIEGELRLDDGVAPFGRFSVIYASSIENIGLGFRPTYRAREKRGCFQVFGGPLDARELIRCLGKIRRGVATNSPHVWEPLGRRLAIEFRDPTSYMIDGELMEPTSRLVVETGPVIRVIRR